MGVGIETSSHIYGLFQETVVAVELVLQDGSRVTCSKVIVLIGETSGQLGAIHAATLRSGL